jgi:hypothetical protein
MSDVSTRAANLSGAERENARPTLALGANTEPQESDKWFAGRAGERCGLTDPAACYRTDADAPREPWSAPFCSGRRR